MTPIPEPIQRIFDGSRRRLEALRDERAGVGSAIPADVRAAIHAGHVGQATVYCDHCGVEETADYIGETTGDRFSAARMYLATQDWHINPGYDGCPDHPQEQP